MAEHEHQNEISSLRKRVHDFADVITAQVTRGATLSHDVSHLLQMFTEHKNDSKAFMSDTRETLESINEQVTKTNGRVNGHDREIRDIKETLTRGLWLILGLNATVIGGAIVYWVTRR